jgi:2-oxoglutarate ferredoxin oxidoreductase subunit alpha
MSNQRAEKVARIATDIPLIVVDDPPSPNGSGAEILVLGWGSTYGSIAAGVRRLRARNMKVAHAQLRHLNPFPSNLGDVLHSYSKVLVPEMNLGQLVKLIRAEYLVDAKGISKMRGKPFQVEPY